MVALRNTAPTCRRHAHRRVPIAGEPGDDVVARPTDSGRGARAFNRRDAIVLTTAWLSAGSAVSAPAAFAVESPQPDFAVFADAKNLFRLEYPVGWQEVNKAGATVLLRDPTQKYSQIGVTVSPVKIASLAEFGSVRDIGEKLTQAEAAKESTVPGGVTLVSEGERVGPPLVPSKAGAHGPPAVLVAVAVVVRWRRRAAAFLRGGPGLLLGRLVGLALAL